LETKKCSKCKKEKNLNDFCKDKYNKDGLKSSCKECDLLYRKNRNIQPSNIKSKICTKCKQEKTIDNFNTDKLEKDGYRAWCKECCHQYNKTYRRKVNNEYTRNYYINNTLRVLIGARICNAKKNNLPYDSQEDLLNCLQPIYDKGKCEICDRDLISSAGRHQWCSPSIDRIVPKYGYVVGNIAILCWECNKIKNNATPEKLFQIAEWYQERLEDDFFIFKNNEIL
jgi:hypothetical protein